MKALLRLSDTPGDFRLGDIEEPAVKPGMVKSYFQTSDKEIIVISYDGGPEKKIELEAKIEERKEAGAAQRREMDENTKVIEEKKAAEAEEARRIQRTELITRAVLGVVFGGLAIFVGYIAGVAFHLW